MWSPPVSGFTPLAGNSQARLKTKTSPPVNIFVQGGVPRASGKQWRRGFAGLEAVSGEQNSGFFTFSRSSKP
jgi:hypothetical protein